MNVTSLIDAPIGCLAARQPECVPVLESFGLDYCCHGERSLGDACAARMIDRERVLESLQARLATTTTTPQPHANWQHATMTELADHIERVQHAFARDALARLGNVAPKVASTHGSTHPELKDVETTIRTLAEDMHDHMIREERVLFPWIRRLEKRSEIQGGPPWSVRRPIDCMVHDHVAVGALLSTLRRLTRDYAEPPEACGSYRSMLATLAELERDTHLHIHLENNILFPAAARAEAERSRARA